jgi:hypothetical protein
MPLLPLLRADVAALADVPLIVNAPGFLLDRPDCAVTAVHPSDLLLPCIDALLEEGASNPADLSALPHRPRMAYGLFLPTFSALGDRLGTLLTVLPFLRFAREQLEADALILLPLSQMGQTNRKGHRGSPFATRDPFAIDAAYADRLLPQWSSHDLYRCVNEAANRAGLRIGSIVPLATVSIDSPLIARFPDLAYWWSAEPSRRLVAEGGGSGSGVRIRDRDRTRFESPPSPEAVQQRLVAGEAFFVTDGSPGPVLTPCNALPDVSPDMNATYTWEDVVSVNYTALDHPVAHAEHSSAPEQRSRSAWSVMPEVVAWHLRHGEQVLQIDVLSSVPCDVVQEGIAVAQSHAPLIVGGGCCSAAATPIETRPWILGEELWSFTGPEAVDAIVGPFVYCAAPYARHPEQLVTSLDYHVRLLAETPSPKPFLAGVSTHDTVPLDPVTARPLLLFLWLLPGSVPFVFSGAEHGAMVPCNREFGFSRKEQDGLSYADLQMFSPRPLDWAGLAPTWPGTNQIEAIGFLHRVREAASGYLDVARLMRPWDLGAAGPFHKATGYVVDGPDGGTVAVAANFSTEQGGITVAVPDAVRDARALAWIGERPPDLDRDGGVHLHARSAIAWLPQPVAGPLKAGRWAGWLDLHR